MIRRNRARQMQSVIATPLGPANVTDNYAKHGSLSRALGLPRALLRSGAAGFRGTVQADRARRAVESDPAILYDGGLHTGIREVPNIPSEGVPRPIFYLAALRRGRR